MLNVDTALFQLPALPAVTHAPAIDIPSGVIAVNGATFLVTRTRCANGTILRAKAPIPIPAYAAFGLRAIGELNAIQLCHLLQRSASLKQRFCIVNNGVCCISMLCIEAKVLYKSDHVKVLI
jgi:hypothetical protein